MLKRILFTIGILTLFVTINGIYAQDETLRILAIDYMGEALEAADVYNQGYDIEVTVVDRRKMGGVVVDGSIVEYDLILTDNLTIDPFLSELGRDIFVPPCTLIDCPLPPEPIPLCELNPWLPFCNPIPCPPDVLWCPLPPIVWDVPIIIDPWDPMPWSLDQLIEVVETEQVMVDPRNQVGFFLEPAIFDLARPNFTIELEEAFLVFTPACNYVMHFDEFQEMGFLPIAVEGYQETPFTVGPYIPSTGNVELAAEFTSLLLNDASIQMNLFEATGLLPGNPDVLGEILPQ